MFHTVQQSFLPEIEIMLRDKIMSVDEVNDYFFIWVRQHYHEKVHSATKQKPMLCFESDNYPLRRVDLDILMDAFLVEETRKADKTGVFKLNGSEYQAPLELARAKILVRYDLFDLDCVQVSFENQRYTDAYRLEVPENVDYDAVKEEPDIIPPHTGLNLFFARVFCKKLQVIFPYFCISIFHNVASSVSLPYPAGKQRIADMKRRFLSIKNPWSLIIQSFFQSF